MYCPVCYDTEAEPRCRTCRNNRQYRYLGHDTHNQCKECGVATKLFANNSCRQCNDRANLKECSQCSEVKLKALSFPAAGKRCIDCNSGCNCGECKACLITAGLKRCRVCERVKVAHTDFHPQRAVCVVCYRERNRKKMVDRRKGA